MSFIQKSIGSDIEFGKDLKELRLLRGWSKKQLQEYTGIHESIITIFEEERFSELSDVKHAEYHVRNMVKALDGRVPFFIQKYRGAIKERGLSLENPKKYHSFIHRVKSWELFTPSRYVPILLILPLAFLLIWYLYFQISSLTRAPVLNIIAPADFAVIREPTLEIHGFTDPSASVLINGKKAIVEQDGYFSLSLDLPRGMNELEIVAKRQYGGMNSVIRYVTFAPVHGPSFMDPLPDLNLDIASSTTSTIN
ncbi:MAG: hypothetical protein ACOYUZ_05025 [Patescibacteria group bacterium]